MQYGVVSVHYNTGIFPY